MTLRRHFRAFLAAGIVTAAAAASGAALAKFSRKHASECMTFGGIAKDQDWHIENDSAFSTLTFLCATTDNDYFPKANITLAEVFGFDGSNQAGQDPEARNCSNGPLGAGGCSAIVTPPVSSGEFTLRPAIPSRWNNGFAEFAYTWITVPPKDGTSRSYLSGVFLAD